MTAGRQRDPSPFSGKFPCPLPGGQRIADSTFIRGYLERTYGLDFDEGLDARGRAQAWAIERMVENHLGWVATHARWLDADNFAKGPAHFFDGAPAGVREEVQAEVQRRVHGTIGRHSDLETVALGVRSLAVRPGSGQGVLRREDGTVIQSYDWVPTSRPRM